MKANSNNLMMRRDTFRDLFLLFSVAEASSLNGQVLGFLDGDTIEVFHNAKSQRILLQRIDCPEKGLRATVLEVLENDAREARKGPWVNPNQIPYVVDIKIK